MTVEVHPQTDFLLPITERGVIRLVPRLRETYLDPDVEGSTVVIQAVGYEVNVLAWSSNENIVIHLPVDGFRVSKPYTRTVRRWGVDVGRYRSYYHKAAEPGKRPWWDQGVLDEAFLSTSQKPGVRATVETHDNEKPDL